MYCKKNQRNIAEKDARANVLPVFRNALKNKCKKLPSSTYNITVPALSGQQARCHSVTFSVFSPENVSIL